MGWRRNEITEAARRKRQAMERRRTRAQREQDEDLHYRKADWQYARPLGFYMNRCQAGRSIAGVAL